MDKISSDRFIELFITLEQMRYLNKASSNNLLNSAWSFKALDLQDFILYSKKDYRFKEFLSCFNFKYAEANIYSMDLVLALNRAKEKHLITGIFDDVVYISRYYINKRIIDENFEYFQLMSDFINNFEYYCLDKNIYLATSECFVENEDLRDNTRMIFDLQRRIVKTYEDKE